MTDFGISPELTLSMAIGLIGLTRLLIFISFAVFMGPSLTMAVKLPLCIALYLPIHPLIAYQVDHFTLINWMSDAAHSGGANENFATSLLNFIGNQGINFETLLIFGLIFVKEALVGFILAFVSSLIFYALMSAGILIDNQRGATAAQENEYLSQESSTPTGTVFLMAATTLFFTSGGFMALVGLLYLSYVAWPVVEPIPFIYSSRMANLGGSLINDFASLMLLVAAPFVLVSLLCDIALGIMNRFAPQLNVFILAMPIKSAVAAFLLIIYLSPLYDHMLKLFMTMRAVLMSLMR